MDKIIKIGDTEIGMRATALTPRLYRSRFGRDLLLDMQRLREEAQRLAGNPDREHFTSDALGIFEDASYIMAKQYDATLPDTPEEWLDEMDMFNIYFALPQIFELWNSLNKTTAVPKKK